jgi:hypothetical protein
MLGDLVWQTEALEIPAERPWPIRRLLGEDDEEVRENIARIVSIQKKYPKMIMVPAHDERAFRFLKDLAGAK